MSPFFVQYFVKLCEVTLSPNFFQNLPRDALPDGSPVREKLANFKRPKKFKTSENDFSHGSFFLRIGGISKLELGMEFSISSSSLFLE